jgi:F1F0 ATPase subunit 2
MNNLLPLLIVVLAGFVFGTFFFGGLWLTVQRGLTSSQPAWWFFISTLLRTGTVLVGFYFISSGDWRRLLACLIGFFVARVVVTRLSRNSKEGPDAS